MNGPYGERFPYTNFHDLNLDWVIKIAKDFLDQYTHIQEIIAQGIIDIGNKTDEGLEALDEKAEALEALLQAWYDTHSEDIANQLADALDDLSDALTNAINTFNDRADAKAVQTLATIPADYTELYNLVIELKDNLNDTLYEFANNKILPITHPYKYIDLSGTTVTMVDNVPAITDDSYLNRFSLTLVACSEGDWFNIEGTGGSSTRLYGFVDASGNVLEKANANATLKRNIIAPANSAWLIMNRSTLAMKTCYYGAGWKHSLNNITKLCDYNLIPLSISFDSYTLRGVTFSVGSDGDVIDINGTKTTEENLMYIPWNYEQGIPKGFAAGETYLFSAYLESANFNTIQFRVYLKDEDNNISYTTILNGQFINIPSNTVGIGFNIFAPSGLYTYTHDKLYISAVKVNKLKELNFITEAENWIDAPRNILPNIIKNVTNTSYNGISYTFSGDKTKVRMNGTASGLSRKWLYLYTDPMPNEIIPGNSYKLIFIPDIPNKMFMQVFIQLQDENVLRTTYYSTSIINIPETATGVTITVGVEDGTVCNNKYAYMELLSMPYNFNVKHSNNVNTASYMYCCGSSFLIGLVYPDGTLDHRASYENSPWGNIAMELHIPEENTDVVLKGSTGLIHDGGNGNILNTIKATDLSKYDYVLTEINRPDLGQAYEFGTIDGSTAGDGTVLGAVLDLINYMKQSNPNCSLIIVGPPPSATAENARGEYVFTYVYGDGKSIADVDALMHQFAVLHHFIYIDWEDLNLSYYYYTLCWQDPPNVHPMKDATLRVMGQYLARCLNYSQNYIRGQSNIEPT